MRNRVVGILAGGAIMIAAACAPTKDAPVETPPEASPGRQSPASLTTNEAAIAIITESEGLRLKAYQNGGQWLIGYGHAATAKPGMTITEAKAVELLKSDLEMCESAIESAVTVPMTENEFSAVVSLCYNIGTGNLRSSSVVKRLNEGDYAAAADAILLWNKAGGKVNEHLASRREDERSLFLTS
ncbi:MAG: lysozyme [Pseudomonadota bacterium]